MFYGTGGPPGIGTTQSAVAFPPILDNDRGAIWIDGGRFLDSNTYDWANPTAPTIVTPGTILGKITSTGKYSNAILGITTISLTTSGTTLTVSAAQAAAIVQRVGSSGTGTISLVGPPTAGGTVATTAVTFSAVNTTTGAITISATSVAYVLGSFVIASDGSGAPLALLDGQDFGVSVSQAGVRQDAQIPRLLVGGEIISKNVPGLLSGDASSIAWLKTQLNGNGRRFIWLDEY